MTSEVDAGLPAATEAFIWIWLPGTFEPVIAGRIERRPHPCLHLWPLIP
jgi:serine/threonine-protein kinase HipA